MSVTVSAVPFFLLYSVIGGVVTFSKMAHDVNEKNRKLNNNYNDYSDFHFEKQELEELYNKDFETQIMDKDLLIRTLTEHGAENIVQGENEITCTCEAFHLSFFKTAEDKPYNLRISYNSDYKLNELVENIGTEYTANAQEVSYNKIKERLEEQNLEIENEEIYDDNTIVLTVNLE